MRKKGLTEDDLLKGADASKEKKKNKYQVKAKEYDIRYAAAVYVASS